MKFKFDYSLSYKERKQLAEAYQTDDENELIKIWEYVLSAYEKENKLSSTKDKIYNFNHQRILIDQQQGIRSYVDLRNGNIVDHQYSDVNFIDEQIAAYEELKGIKFLRDRLDKAGHTTSPAQLVKEINNDIRECRYGLIMKPVEIKEGIRSRHDLFKNIEIDYGDKTQIKAILGAYKLIRWFNPQDTLHTVQMDINAALESVNLTYRQRETLECFINGETLKGRNRDMDFIINKIMRELEGR